MRRSTWREAVVWVTGASAGIGAACARACATRGASVVLSARRRDRLDALAQELGARAHALVLDVTDPAAVTAAAEEIARRHGRLDVLVANAGVGAFSSVEATGEEAVRDLIETNLSGVLRCIRASLPLLRAAPRPARIVIVSSSVALRGFPGLGVYSATKAALHALADALRVELAVDGIDVSLVAPGLTRTEFAAAARGHPGAEDRGGIPPERVAAVILRAAEEGRPLYALNPKARVAAILNLIVPRFLDRRLARFAPPSDPPRDA